MDSNKYKFPTNTKFLPAGTIYFPECLNDDQQKHLVEICTTISNENGNEKLVREREDQFAFPVMYYNWPFVSSSEILSNFSEHPTDVIELATNAFKFKREHQEAETGTISYLPEDVLVPDSMYGIIYPPNGEFGPHVDGAKTWTFAISIGSAANFFYDEPTDTGTNTGTIRHFLKLNSGDGCLFNGGKLFHGISEIFPSDVPSWWKSTEFGKLGSRFNLQFRDLNKARNIYRPLFDKRYVDSNKFIIS